MRLTRAKQHQCERAERGLSSPAFLHFFPFFLATLSAAQRENFICLRQEKVAIVPVQTNIVTARSA